MGEKEVAFFKKKKKKISRQKCLWRLLPDSSSWITGMPCALCTARISFDTYMDLCQGKVQNWATVSSQM